LGGGGEIFYKNYNLEEVKLIENYIKNNRKRWKK
jgi:hypothetical protein